MLLIADMEYRLPQSLADAERKFFHQGWDDSDPWLRIWYGQFKGWHDAHAHAAMLHRRILDELDAADPKALLPEYEEDRRSHRAYIEEQWQRYDEAATAGRAALDRLDKMKKA